MGTEAVEPLAIRNVILIGDADGVAGLAHRLRRLSGSPGTSIRWLTDRVEHTLRVAEVSSRSPERSIRVAEGVIAVVDATVGSTPRLEAMLRAADDYQVARLCLITGLDRPGADFDRCVRAIAAIRGAVPLPVQLPLGVGAGFEGVLDLVRPVAETPGGPRRIAAQRHRDLVHTVSGRAAAMSPGRLRHGIRQLTRLGEVVPILCCAAPGVDDLAPLLDAVVRYLPSPMEVCQPEHALDQ
ncbi:GTP-binding protein [Nocardia goodfellowii]